MLGTVAALCNAEGPGRSCSVPPSCPCPCAPNFAFTEFSEVACHLTGKSQKVVPNITWIHRQFIAPCNAHWVADHCGEQRRRYMAEEPRLRNSEEIQGNVLGAFNKDHMTFLLLNFTNRDGARNWLNAVL